MVYHVLLILCFRENNVSFFTFDPLFEGNTLTKVFTSSELVKENRLRMKKLYIELVYETYAKSNRKPRLISRNHLFFQKTKHNFFDPW
jgi:hypothetical protein